MRLVIVSTYVPFVSGGGTMIADSLKDALEEFGHDVEMVLVPWRDEWASLVRQTLAIRCLDIGRSGKSSDLAITLRYPSFAIRHPAKVAWFIHHYRSAYDLWGTRYGEAPATVEAIRVRDTVRRSDTNYLREALRVFTNSYVVAARLKLFNGIESDAVLYPPLPHPELYTAGEAGEYFLYASRLSPIKRQVLAIEAMKYTRGSFTLKLVGSADWEPNSDLLLQFARELGVVDRVEFLGYVSERAKAQLTGGALGALYLAYQEDSYGYSTLEAMHAHKAIITLTDSGGTREIISDGVNGLVVEPNPVAIADAMDRLWFDRRRAVEMGENAYDSLRSFEMTWAEIVDRLLGAPTRSGPSDG